MPVSSCTTALIALDRPYHAVLSLEEFIAAKFAARPDQQILSILPRLGTVRAASLLAEIGDCRERFPIAPPSLPRRRVPLDPAVRQVRAGGVSMVVQEEAPRPQTGSQLVRGRDIEIGSGCRLGACLDRRAARQPQDLDGFRILPSWHPGPVDPSMTHPQRSLTAMTGQGSDNGERPNDGFWTNQSVRDLAGDLDPIEAITIRARQVVIDAIEHGWRGPPFDPLALARRLDLDVQPREDLADAQVVRSTNNRMRIEFNPNRPRGRLRYSIAHEIAHTFFADAGAETRHRTGTGAIEEVADTDEWQLELLCNVAAGELLVPGLALPDDELDAAAVDINRLMALRARFDISTEAMLRRVAQTTTHLLTVVAAAHVTGGDPDAFRVDYTAASMSWDLGLRRGARISSGVMAECTAVGFTAEGKEAWGGCEESKVQAVGIPPYPGQRLPRVAAVATRLTDIPLGTAITYLTGDATQPRGEGARIIAHLVNDQARAWGARGFAGELKRAQPRAAEAYRAWTIARADNRRLGNVHIVEMTDGLNVASMVAQEGFGDAPSTRLRYDALSECLQKLSIAAQRLHATVHMPRIGTGQAHGLWHLVAELIDDKLLRSGVKVTVYSRPGEHAELIERGG